jgi:luciferase family oxidoreductase group 1
VKCSIVDLAITAPTGTEGEALEASLVTARQAAVLGFHRIWFAEHHLTRGVASHHPEILMSAVAALTTGIRIGSGGVLVNHYSPLKIAEMFKQMEALFPGRIDLGMGRATSGPLIDAALNREPPSRRVDDYEQRLLETLAWLHAAFPDTHPFAPYRILPSVHSLPETWLLGSSLPSARIAAGLGIGYTFAGFLNPTLAARSLRSYRKRFRSAGFGSQTPRTMLSVNVSVGEDAADGRRLVSSVKGLYARIGRGDSTALVPPPEVANREMSSSQREEPTSIVDGRWPRFVAGNPDQVRATLGRMIEECNADEIIFQDMIVDAADRRASHARLAEMFDLTPRSLTDDLNPAHRVL